jgi:anti-sigma factor RsiW
LDLLIVFSFHLIVVFVRDEAAFHRAKLASSGERWVVGSEIFWQLRVETMVSVPMAAIACVFKKFMSRLPDGRPQVHKVERNAWHAIWRRGSEVAGAGFVSCYELNSAMRRLYNG